MVIEIEGCINRRSWEGGRESVFRLKIEAPAKHLFREKNVLCFFKGIAVQGRKYRAIWAFFIKVYRVHVGWRAGFYIRRTEKLSIY